MKRVMALDVGEKRIGVALNWGTPFAFPYTVLLRKGKTDIVAVLSLAREFAVDTIVVGFPRRTDGTIGKEAQALEEFAGELRKHFPGEVVLWDERFSTKEAEKHLIALDTSRARRRKLIDKIAACLILEAYLAREST
ncbi:MAG: Holliday junction resolvase RuvX [Candidatus Caldatribacterium sp.]|uniref:Holliday junction resolvase RuvX n=1 Tax=Candidatus Caldatribacterium sp. TaxID=2282143 RepID=UPI002995D30F|nr:Holliday junction resolvase RuvX [Candidatus Caldatribacterium sp.]MCX7729941.1 Holliday junction resolvase RuvX [Candidatus Caldatribacterium sp.]MDW8081697.1 Holliday junction resolvase RuvX [Candidatus Calescibacterium sp.]